MVFINPVISLPRGGSEEAEEGCLSLPGLYGTGGAAEAGANQRLFAGRQRDSGWMSPVSWPAAFSTSWTISTACSFLIG